MNSIDKTIAELRDQQQRIAEAILALERLRASQAPRRGRPPSWLSVITANPAEPPAAATLKGRKKRILSPEARQKMAEAQRRRWAMKKAPDNPAQDLTLAESAG